ncbi:MAG TPA: tetraacyldisaccharide 4'-kinase [Candidatus Desulfaltia sp.]|nr:tetraacyldisaccharide 4'-kinase [Candidatus Desulfaltia sp.]
MYIPGEMAPLLLAFSLFSRLISRIKNFLYDHGVFKARRAPLPVISVGNISLGGTEKTPLAIEILGRLLEQGRRPALISRGYRGRWEKKGGILSEGRGLLGSWEDGGDEPFLIARSFPAAGVYIGKERLISCRRASAAGFDIVVLDDGFQHRRLARDLDIVLFSSAERIALREPRSALRRGDILLIKAGEKRDKIVAGLKGSRAETILSYLVVSRGLTDLWTEEDVSPDRPAKKRLLAFCGIARPSRFLEELRKMGYEIVSFLPYPDHHPYPRLSLEKIVKAYRRAGAEALITTEKDGLKIAGRRKELADISTYVLRIGLALEPGFDDLLKDFIKTHPAA